MKSILKYTLVVMVWLAFSCEQDEPLSPPEIASFTPVSGNPEFSGIAATTVTISGTNFGDDPENVLVQFNGTTATISSLTPTDIVVTVPVGATTGKITVTVNGMTATLEEEFTVLAPNPTLGKSFPKKLILTYWIGGFNEKKDTSVYQYEYKDERISVITRSTRKWDTNGILLGPLVFAGTDLEILNFSYLDRKIKITTTLNSSQSGSFEFEFDNDYLLFPSAFKKYDTQGVLQGEGQMTYDDQGFLTKCISPNFVTRTTQLSVESGNILETHPTKPMITYAADLSPINQFTAFSYFIYKPFYPWGGIDPISIAFNWFRPSKNLISSYGLRLGGGMGGDTTLYTYGYSNGGLSSITGELNANEYVIWGATIEF